VDVPPSPNAQRRAVIGEPPFVDRSVNATASGTNPLVWFAPKFAVARSVGHWPGMYDALVSVSEPTRVETPSETVYVPGAV